ncbi:LD-carboxypeptidase [Mumia zhuanghuii]|uniref:LD-carboxypeptidase n=2 Tax=Mumia TaxID=1546255 RepID=A0ABW1QQH7_9ACTN|nr:MULTISPECIES: LD-carboxypeptidase [Mumia]KAA1420072.1 LD-carboxypeptidase [Mumia zhuanghuii]
MPRHAPSLGPLARGDRVALVAPAGPVPSDQLDRASELLRTWGLEPVESKHVRDHHPTADYLAGTDADRAADLTDAWCDPTVDAVFCVRGGYGSVRVLDHLDAEALRAARPKPLFGSSDVTAIHEYWRESLGVSTWFTPMIATLALLDDAAATADLRRAMLEPWDGRTYTRSGAGTITTGQASGTLIGGNLAVLAMTIGARSRPAPRPGPYVALLEDVNEEPYRIDGFLTSLLRSGWFDDVAGIVLGSWDDCGDLEAVREVCTERLGPLGVPIAWELGFGHGPAAPSIPLGTVVDLDASTPALTIRSGARLATTTSREQR